MSARNSASPQANPVRLTEEAQKLHLQACGNARRLGFEDDMLQTEEKGTELVGARTYSRGRPCSRVSASHPKCAGSSRFGGRGAARTNPSSFRLRGYVTGARASEQMRLGTRSCDGMTVVAFDRL